jgi:phosphoribosylformylglycinamidine cyclo-ligase
MLTKAGVAFMLSERTINYIDLGVSSSKEEVQKAIENIDSGLFPDSFCKIVPDIFTGNTEWCIITHADGAGTKSALAYMYYKETGDVSIFRGIAQDSIVMNLDDMLCVGATDRFILSNTIGKNRFHIDGEVIAEVIYGYEDFIKHMNTYGITIKSAGGETADLGDLVRTIVVDSTLTTRMQRDKVIRSSKISPGDFIIGLSSSGKSKYEEKQNSGIGSNGFTLARHVLLDSEYRHKFPETFDISLDSSLTYQGSFHLSDTVSDLGETIGEALLSPTRTYAPVMKDILSQYQNDISFAVHCTGGGQVKCLNFGKKIRYVKDNLFSPPRIFRIIQEAGNIDWHEMYKTFNMGHRMELIASAEISDSIIEISKRFGVDARIIGRCERSEEKNCVDIRSEFGDFKYR